MHRPKLDCCYCHKSFHLSEMDEHVAKDHPPRQKIDPTDPQPSTSAQSAQSAQSFQTSEHCTQPEEPVNPLNTFKGGTVQPFGVNLRRCPVCGIYFSAWEYYRGHINKYHFRMLVTCKYCKKTVFAPMMSGHMRRTHSTCYICLKGFASDKVLQDHRMEMECRQPDRKVNLLEKVIIPPPPEPPAPTPPEPAPPAPALPTPVVQDIQPKPAPEPEPEPPAPTPVEEAKPASRPGRPYVCEYCAKVSKKVRNIKIRLIHPY